MGFGVRNMKLKLKIKLSGMIILLGLLLIGNLCCQVQAAEEYYVPYGTMEIKAGKSKAMDIYCDNVKLKPSGFKWSSNKPECVSVVGGIVKGKKTGYARVTAEKNKKTVSCMVYVYNKTQTVLFKNYRGQVKITRDSDLTLKPEKLGKGITYTSSDYDVANVTADGKVIPFKEGKVTITCCSYGASKYVSKIVVVIGKAARDISIKKQLSLETGEKIQLDVKAVPANRVLSAIKYSSDDSTVASVDNKGQIIGKSAGRANITVTAVGADGTIQKNVQVYVAEADKETDITQGTDTGYIYHRGDPTSAPENTLPAFEIAGKNGAQYVETDVYETKDGVLVIFHDTSLKRMCGVDKNILDMTYAELCQYPIIYGRNAAMFPNNVVPTLKQYIDCCNTYNMTPVIEIKQIPSANGMKQFKQLLSISKKQPLIISLRDSYLITLRQLGIPYKMQWVIKEPITDSIIRRCSQYNWDVSTMYNFVKKEDIPKAHQMGVGVAVWLCKDRKIADLFETWGVDYITCEINMEEML